MKQPNSSHFHAGKAARHAGKPCINSDARLSIESRAQWYAGWNYQDAQTRPAPTLEEVEQNDSFFANLRAELRGPKP